MIRTVIIFLLLAYTCNCIAQSTVKKLLKEGDFNKLKAYYEQTQAACSGSNEWIYYREIVQGYSEGKLVIYECKTNSFSAIDVITHNSSIILWRINNDAINKPVSERRNYYIDSFTNAPAFANFRTYFKQIYKLPLDKKDLFNKVTFSLGGCGYDPALTVELTAIRKIIFMRDSTSLQRWLRCANTEKQLYAIAGLTDLKKKGYKFDAYTQKIIDHIAEKSGNVLYCEGDMYFESSILDIVKKIVGKEQTQSRK